MAFRIWLGLLCFRINCYGGGQTETSKLLEKILNLFAVYTNIFDQSYIQFGLCFCFCLGFFFCFFFYLLQNMSLHLKYIIFFIWEHNIAEI